MRSDGNKFGLTIAANANWKNAGCLLRATVWIFGRHERFVHLGWQLRISWWRGVPFLLSIKEPA